MEFDLSSRQNEYTVQYIYSNITINMTYEMSPYLV